MNLVTCIDFSSHLAIVLNLTLIANNLNNHLVFFYESFTVTAFYNSVSMRNGSIPLLMSDKNNQSILQAVLSDSRDLDTDSLTSLRLGLKKASGFLVVIQMSNKVKLKMEWLKSKRVGIRVTCDRINMKVPVGKTLSVASVTNSECKVDLRWS